MALPARQIQHMVQTSFWGADGKPLSAQEFLQQLFGDLPVFFHDETQLRKIWGHPETRQKLLDGLADRGYTLDQLNDARELINAENSDLFDVLAYVAFAMPPTTREQRVDENRDLIYSHYDDKQQAFLDYILSKYVSQGVTELQPEKLASYLELMYQGIHEAREQLGEMSEIRELFVEFQKHLYQKTKTA